MSIFLRMPYYIEPNALARHVLGRGRCATCATVEQIVQDAFSGLSSAGSKDDIERAFSQVLFTLPGILNRHRRQVNASDIQRAHVLAFKEWVEQGPRRRGRWRR